MTCKNWELLLRLWRLLCHNICHNKNKEPVTRNIVVIHIVHLICEPLLILSAHTIPLPGVCQIEVSVARGRPVCAILYAILRRIVVLFNEKYRCTSFEWHVVAYKRAKSDFLAVGHPKSDRLLVQCRRMSILLNRSGS